MVEHTLTLNVLQRLHKDKQILTSEITHNLYQIPAFDLPVFYSSSVVTKIITTDIIARTIREKIYFNRSKL